MLHSVMDDYVAFTRYNISSNAVVQSILKCINLDKKKCEDNPTCLYVKKDGKCKLQIPKTNLISGGDNEEIYFGRLADEMIRYSIIRMFILNPRNFLSFLYRKSERLLFIRCYVILCFYGYIFFNLSNALYKTNGIQMLVRVLLPVSS